MSWIQKTYNNNRNGIIFTLIFHIVIFVALNISQFRAKQKYVETEIVIDFPEEIVETKEVKNQVEKEINQNIQNSQTNIASNRSSQKFNDLFDDDYQQELERAQELVKNVSKQLSKEIPTIEDLQMPEEITEGLDPDSILNKLYSGESNIEYYLENRFHLRLPIPVYLAQQGGVVKVNITVNTQGKVITAIPNAESNLSVQILSYAKTAALRTKFNSISKQEPVQNGYIIYTFIAQ